VQAPRKVLLRSEVEVATAKVAAQPGLKIIGVTTLAQTLHDLEHSAEPPATPHAAPLSHFLKADAVVWKEWTIAEFSQARANRRPR